MVQIAELIKLGPVFEYWQDPNESFCFDKFFYFQRVILIPPIQPLNKKISFQADIDIINTSVFMIFTSA